jgi:transcription initiation factor TFIIIB Brf1 subunit/transcription initiation factor TFIIB
VESNLHRLEIESYVKQIEALKISETKLKRTLNTLKSQLNGNLKEVADSRDKYAKELELNRDIEDRLR